MTIDIGAGFLGSARASRALSGASPENPESIRYAKRRLPHFERPWAKCVVCFATHRRCHLSPAERDLVQESVLYAHDHQQYELYVACIMPDHVHLLFEPQVKKQSQEGRTVFWSLTQILHGIKSASAHRINKAAGGTGTIWEKDYFDRLIRSEADLQEKFSYICRNPWTAAVVGSNDEYPWLWTQDMSSAGAPKTAREARALPNH